VEQALQLYRQNYKPSARHPQPQATICVWALAADTEKEARHQLKTREHWRLGCEQGLRWPLAAPEDVDRQDFNTAERASMEAVRAKAMVGTGEQVLERISTVARELALDEIVINTWAYDPQVRRHSYALIARAAGMV
jgi:alkanesulfonate monooxygenase SsuD/methylene tetrahydromethanopterin reductase-like flavin-dependent oxidoreductase (luciferase family)